MLLVPRESWHDLVAEIHHIGPRSFWKSNMKFLAGKKVSKKKKKNSSFRVKDGVVVYWTLDVTKNEYWFYILWFWKVGLKSERWILRDWRRVRKWNSWKYCCQMDMEYKLIKEIFGMKGKSILRFIIWISCMNVILKWFKISYIYI